MTLISLFVLGLSAASAQAQTCPPGTICHVGLPCAPPQCAGGDALHSVTLTSGASFSPPSTGSALIARFVTAPGRQLVRVEIDVRASLVDGQIAERNLTPLALSNEQLTLGSSVQVQANFAPLLATGLVLTPSTPTFSVALGPTTGNSNPNEVCGGLDPLDSFKAALLAAEQSVHMCIDDPVVLASELTWNGGNQNVDLSYTALDTSLHVGNANACVVFTNNTAVRFMTTYFWCEASEPGTPFCLGDNTLPEPCPCLQFGQFGRGCGNSANFAGALLQASGSASPDTVHLTASGLLPSALSILLQGDNVISNGTSFGDGVRCVAGNLLRLYVRSASAGVVTMPAAGSPGLRQRSSMLGDPIASGGTRYYTVYYRDPDPNFCPAPIGNTFNATGGYYITWP